MLLAKRLVALWWLLSIPILQSSPHNVTVIPLLQQLVVTLRLIVPLMVRTVVTAVMLTPPAVMVSASTIPTTAVTPIVATLTTLVVMAIVAMDSAAMHNAHATPFVRVT